MEKMLTKRQLRILIMRHMKTGCIIEQHFRHVGFTREEIEAELDEMENEIDKGPSISDVLRHGK